MTRTGSVVGRYGARPRAPSPPRSPSDSDNTYSVVQDSVLMVSSPPPPRMPPKQQQYLQQQRMFGDSVNNSPAGSVFSDGSNSRSSSSSSSSSTSSTSSSSSISGGMQRLYTQKRLVDIPTVGEIKTQFVKNTPQPTQFQKSIPQNNPQPPRPAPIVSINSSAGIRNGHIPSAAERELSGMRDIQRGKSFLEARTAVQKHIERMFSDATAQQQPPRLMATHTSIKHTMHGVSHALPDEDRDFVPPPPVHYGVEQAIRDGSALGFHNRTRAKVGNNNTSNNIREDFAKWQSVESLLPEKPPTPQLPPQQQHHVERRPELAQIKSFRSMENVSSQAPARGLARTLVDVDVDSVDVSDRLKKFSIEAPASPASSSSSSTSSSSSSSTASGSAVVQRLPDKSASGADAAISKPSPQPDPTPAPAKKDYVKHKVDYLGALPIGSKATNLAALQVPLKELYFKYRARRNMGHSNLPGTLEINDTGLKVQYIRELHKGLQEIFNPFPTIAVWAAVKFVHKRDVTAGGNMLHRFAFLPLISDPDSQDKHRLFHDLDLPEVELAADSPHPPVFACVMRRAGHAHASGPASKQLECHGFVCASSEDAIIIAANLYQALLETMRKQKLRSSMRRAAAANNNNNNTLRSVTSSTSSSATTTYDEITPPPTVFSDSDAVSRTPVRPPRRKKKDAVPGPLQRRKSVRSSVRSNRSNRSGRGGIRKTAAVSYDPARKNVRIGGLARKDSMRSNASTSTRRSNNNNNAGGGDFYRSKSVRRSKTAASISSSSSGKPYVATPHGLPGAGALPTSGDIYTKVAIPRSKSFMNVNSQYNLQELFRELKEKEGVESIDDVLKKIITPNGISFNEIKPVYRELLLKLAMTMSQDEIFQRSKNILSQEKKKEKKTKKTVEKKSKQAKKEAASETGGSSTLSSFFKMTFSSSAASSKSNSLAPSKKVSTATSTTSSGYDSSSAFGRSLPSPSSKPLPAVPVSSSLAKKATINKADISGPMPINGSVKPPLISPDSISTRLGNNKSGGDESVDDAYGSCSECGYESVCNYDSCSCRVKIPPPKEYQSLANVVRGGPATLSKTNTLRSASKSNRTATTTLPSSSESEEVYNECSGDSCISTEKCYCSLRGDPRLGPQAQQHRHHGEKLSVTNRGHTTIIHCNGDAGPTSSCCCCASTKSSAAAKDGCSCAKRASLHASASHLAQSSSCSSSSSSSSSAYSSECCSLRRGGHGLGNGLGGTVSSSAGSLLSACESPQTAWRRNTRMVAAQQHHAHHEPAARRTSAASSGSDCSCACSCGSNNNKKNTLSKSQENVLVYSSSSGSSTCSSSFCGHRGGVPPLQLHVPKNYVGGGGTMRRAGSKVLLVSAVDTAGRVMYRGTSSTNLTALSDHDHNHHHNTHSNSNNHHHRGGGHVHDDKSIISMKKSAEIAALFSGARINQTTDIIDGDAASDTASSDDSTDAAYDTRRTGHAPSSSCHASSSSSGSCQCSAKSRFSRADMHSSLGYFP